MKRAAILLVLVLCGTAHAGITRQTVNHAWQTLSRAEGLGNIPLYFEADDDPNAWVLWQDDGTFTVHVTSGLMGVLMNEAEIAGVLGHEIGHVKLNHYSNIIITDTARTIMGANLDRTDILSRTVGEIDADLREASFSREQETDADNYGVALLKRAGYDAWGLYNAMKRFDTSEHNGFSSHPASRERLANLARQAGESTARSGTHSEVDDIASAIMGR